MKIPNAIITMLVGIVLTLVSLWYGQNNNLLPVAASSEALQVDSLFNAMMTISFGLFLLIQGALIIAAIKFRKREGDETDGPPTHGNIALEILWTSVPAVIVLVISVYSFEIYNQMGGLDPMASHDHTAMHAPKNHSGSAIAAQMDQEMVNSETELSGPNYVATGIGASPETQGKTADVSVNVTGLQYAWVFNYPELEITSGELHLIVDKEAQLNISAQDVLHALWLPQFRIKQDAIPGRTTELRFVPRKIGSYPIVCAELCGGYHGAMRTTMIVETPEEFNTWVASQKEVANQPDLGKTIALNPANLSDGDFLAPYAQEMGIDQATLAQINHQ